MAETIPYTIQDERREQRKAAAMKTAPPKAKQVAALRSKAAEAAAQADAAEAEAIREHTALESLLERRVAALAEAALYRRLVSDVETSHEGARVAAIQLIKAADLVTRQSALLALDSLARVAILAPVVKPLLDETTATAADLGSQIHALAAENSIDLRAIFEQCGINAASENPPARYSHLMAGFVGLLK
jgi:hypothetical protein